MLRYFRANESGNTIIVNNQELIEQAKVLAEAYEKNLGREFIVKIEYEN